ncbi:hypothetical protein Ancab_018181 [Ancistrocladus abbreviatus]
MRAGHRWNDASHQKGSYSRVHSVSISMPPSPMGHHMTGTKRVIFSEHGQCLYMQDIPNASPASEPLGSRHAQFYSQQIPKGITYAEATNSLQFPNYHGPPSRNPRDSRFRDRRFDSFKTRSAKVERQLSRLRGKPVEPEPEPKNVQHSENEAMPVDQYFDALEGPELDTLRAVRVNFFRGFRMESFTLAQYGERLDSVKIPSSLTSTSEMATDDVEWWYHVHVGYLIRKVAVLQRVSVNYHISADGSYCCCRGYSDGCEVDWDKATFDQELYLMSLNPMRLAESKPPKNGSRLGDAIAAVLCVALVETRIVGWTTNWIR